MVKVTKLDFKMTSFFYFEQVHEYQVYTFLVDGGHFELRGANGILKQCHIAKSDQSLK